MTTREATAADRKVGAIALVIITAASVASGYGLGKSGVDDCKQINAQLNTANWIITLASQHSAEQERTIFNLRTQLLNCQTNKP